MEKKSKMKVLKAEDVNAGTLEAMEMAQAPSPEIDQAKVEQLREKFDAFQSQLNEKKYSLVLDEVQTSTLLEKLYPAFQWKGYESYAISETYTQLEEKRTGNGINAKFSPEIIEAVFHFLKNHVGTGFELAIPFKQICDQFAVTIQEVNKDRQDLRDLSLELVSTEQGISVENLVEALNKGDFKG
jgi:hypothetical protein